MARWRGCDGEITMVCGEIGGGEREIGEDGGWEKAATANAGRRWVASWLGEGWVAWWLAGWVAKVKPNFRSNSGDQYYVTLVSSDAFTPILCIRTLFGLLQVLQPSVMCTVVEKQRPGSQSVANGDVKDVSSRITSHSNVEFDGSSGNDAGVYLHLSFEASEC
ncbi:hypothetical protein Droror1_Dr00003370 [Drosera rotundifolia]